MVTTLSISLEMTVYNKASGDSAKATVGEMIIQSIPTVGDTQYMIYDTIQSSFDMFDSEIRVGKIRLK